jgi:hypothetical protein
MAFLDLPLPLRDPQVHQIDGPLSVLEVDLDADNEFFSNWDDLVFDVVGQSIVHYSGDKADVVVINNVNDVIARFCPDMGVLSLRFGSFLGHSAAESALQSIRIPSSLSDSLTTSVEIVREFCFNSCTSLSSVIFESGIRNPDPKFRKSGNLHFRIIHRFSRFRFHRLLKHLAIHGSWNVNLIRV